MPKEETCPRRSGDKTKDSRALQVGRMVWRERISESRGSFQFGVDCCLYIKRWATALSTALMRK